MLVQVAELLFTEDTPKTISTRRLARVMLYTGLLLRQVTPEKKAQYTMGSLFALGGLLKIEARNYLETKQKYDASFHTVCPLVEESKAVEDSLQKARRDLSEKDIAYFESKDGFVKIFTHFVKSLVAGDANLINAGNFDYFLRFSADEFVDDIEDERRNDEVKVTSLERAHYTLLFLFDLL
jgi:hypothetical protein